MTEGGWGAACQPSSGSNTILSQRIVITGLASLLLTATAQGVTFYLSDKGLGQGATPGNLSLNVGLGDTFTLYL